MRSTWRLLQMVRVCPLAQWLAQMDMITDMSSNDPDVILIRDQLLTMLMAARDTVSNLVHHM